MTLRDRATTLLGIGLVIAAIVYTLVYGGGLRSGGAAPDFQAPMLGGDTFSLAGQQGRIVVLDFWATWCAPCKKSLPGLQIVHERYEGSDEVLIASVNTDIPPEYDDQLMRFLQQRKLTFPVVLDAPAQKVSQAYKVQSIPTLVVIDPQGRIREVQRGIPSPDPQRIAAHIEELIDAVRQTPAGS